MKDNDSLQIHRLISLWSFYSDSDSDSDCDLRLLHISGNAFGAYAKAFRPCHSQHGVDNVLAWLLSPINMKHKLEGNSENWNENKDFSGC